MAQMTAGDGHRSDAFDVLASGCGQTCSGAVPLMLSTDVMHGFPVPCYKHTPRVDVAGRLAPQAECKTKDAHYRPGELLKRSASLGSDTFDAITAEIVDLPSLMGACTQAAKGAQCAAAVIAACSEGLTVDLEPLEDEKEDSRSRPAVSTAYWVDTPNAAAQLGSTELPSIGSVNHTLGLCKPCAFVFTTGCQSGMNCKFCHLCEQGEKKRRKKERRELRRLTRLSRKCSTAGGRTAVATNASLADLALACPGTLSASRASCTNELDTALSYAASEGSLSYLADATTEAAEGARRAAAIILASTSPERVQECGDIAASAAFAAEATVGGAARATEQTTVTSCSNRSTADTEDLEASEIGESEKVSLVEEPRASLGLGAGAAGMGGDSGGEGSPRVERGGCSGSGLGGAVAQTLQLEAAILPSASPGWLGEANTLKLEDAIAAPKLGSAALPTVGSAFHNLGTCKPCAFAFAGRCQSGVDCKFCHLCGPGEKSRRKKEKRQSRKNWA